jgi:hypothetical protein
MEPSLSAARRHVSPPLALEAFTRRFDGAPA